MATVEEHILLLTDRFTKGMKDAKDATESTSSAFSGLTSMIGTIGAAIGIGSAVKAVFELGIEAEQTQTSFEVMTGGIGNAKKLLGELAQFANVTPFDNKAVEDSAKILLQFGIAGDDIIPTLRMLGDTSGGNAEKLAGMTMAFGKMSSTGKLTGETLDTMITNGFNPLTVISEKTGKSMATLRKEMENGKISVDQVNGAFQSATSEGGMFFGMMDKQSATVGGRISTLQGTMQELGKSIGGALNPALGGLVDLLQSGVQFLSDHKTAMLAVIGAVAGGALAFGVLALATNASAIAFGALNLIMSINPVGAIVVAIGALIAAFVVLWKTSDQFRAFFFGIFSGFKQFFANVVTTFKSFPTLIIDAFKGIPAAIYGVLKGVGGLLTAIVTGDFKSVPALLKNIGGDLLKSNPMTAVAGKIGESLANGVGDAFGKGKNKELAASIKPADVVTSMAKKTAGTETNADGTPKTKTAGVGSGMSGITASAPKNFTINIEKLVEKMIFETSNLTETKSIIKDEITKVLLAAVNDSQIISE